jgi:O-methyltransferase involved in polyketide biosynthesis
MKNDTGSATAVGVAMLRAVHQLVDGEEKLLDDPISLKIVPKEWITYALENRFHYFDPVSMALRTHVLLRSRYAEDCLAEAYKKGIKQFIMLGAGLDTFAYRQPEWAKNITMLKLIILLVRPKKLQS